MDKAAKQTARVGMEESLLRTPPPRSRWSSRRCMDGSSTEFEARKSPSDATFKTEVSTSHGASLVTPDSNTLGGFLAEEEDSSRTPSSNHYLHQKMDELELRWSSSKGSTLSHFESEFDDGSLLSLGSLGSSNHGLTGKDDGIVSIPSRILKEGRPKNEDPSSVSSHGVESVFDRLYNQAKARRRMSNQGSVAGSSVSSRTRTDDSVFDRLYRNEKRRYRQRRHQSQANATLSSPHAIAAAALERRLSYQPPNSPMANLSRRNRVSSRLPSPSTVETSSGRKTVFERLYYKEKRPREELFAKRSSSSRRTGEIGKRRVAMEEIAATDTTPFRLATLLQARWRAFLCRRIFHGQRESATKIQSCWRMYLARETYQIRVHVRGEGRSRPTVLYAAPRLDCRIEGRVRLVQAKWRSSKCRRVFVGTKASAACIQRWWRRQLARSQCDKAGGAVPVVDMNVLESVVAIQSLWRGWKCRQSFVGEREASIVIQSFWRMHIARDTFLIRLHVIEVWPSVRSIGVRDITDISSDTADERVFRADSAVKIQDSWRRRTTGEPCTVDRQACKHETEESAESFLPRDNLFLEAVKIQSIFRGFRSRKGLSGTPHVHSGKNVLSQSPSSAARTIQAMWRKAERRMQSRGYQYSAVIIQSAYRGYVCRSTCLDSERPMGRTTTLGLPCASMSALERNDAARLIQAWWRMASVQRAFLAFVYYTTVIQGAYRGYSSRRRRVRSLCSSMHKEGESKEERKSQAFLSHHGHQLVVEPINRVQALFRGQRVRKEMTRLQSAAVVAQSHFRSWSVRRNLSSLSMAAVEIQCKFRGWRSRRQLLATIANAVAIQALCRGHICRHKVQRLRDSLCHTYIAAMSIQKIMRGVLARMRFNKMKDSIVRLQCFARMECAKRRLSVLRTEEKATLNKAAIVIQGRVRESIQRSKFESVRTATIKIQSLIRREIAREDFASKRRACIRIQSALRSSLARSALSICKASVSLLQSRARAFLARSKFRAAVVAAVRIQCLYRSHLSTRMIMTLRKEMTRRHEKAVVLQRIWRGCLCRSHLAVARAAATLMQSSYRRFVAWSNFSRMVLSVVVVQSFGRQILARRLYCKMTNEWRLAIAGLTKIQSLWRGYLGRRGFALALTSATLIQSLIRGRADRKEYLRTARATMDLQRVYRGFCCRRLLSDLKAELRAMHECAVRIQSLFRGALVRSEQFVMRALVILVQANARRWLVQRDTSRKRQSAILIQSCCRGHLSRLRAGTLRRDRVRSFCAAIRIQAWWRGTLARHLLSMKLLSARKIQSLARMRQARNHFVVCRRASIAIQMATRRSASRAKLVSLRHDRLARNRAATIIQSTWRGCDVRIRYYICVGAIVLLQSVARRRAQRLVYLAALESCTKIQAHYRRIWSNKVIVGPMRETLSRERCAAIMIQSLFRRIISKRILVAAKSRLVLEKIALRRAARVIQWFYYSHKVKNLLRKLQSSSLLLQKSVKGTLSRGMSNFALLQVNAILGSAAFAVFSRLGTNRKESMADDFIFGWECTMSTVRMYASILLQSVYRGHAERVRTERQFGFVRAGSRQKKSSSPPHPSVALAPSTVSPQSLASPRRSPVAVKVVKKLGDRSVQIELCPVTYIQHNHAARVLQAFARRVRQELEERRVARIHLAIDLVPIRAERAANLIVEKAIAGEHLEAKDVGCCIQRLARRANSAWSHFDAYSSFDIPNESIDLAPKTPSVWNTSTTISPIAKVPP